MGIHFLFTSHWNISWAPPPMLGVRLDVLGSTEALEKRGVAVAAGHLKDVRDVREEFRVPFFVWQTHPGISRADKTLVGDVPWSAAINVCWTWVFQLILQGHRIMGIPQQDMSKKEYHKWAWNRSIWRYTQPLESCCGVYTSRKSDVRRQNRSCMAYFSRNCAMFRANVGESAMEWSLFFITAL